MGNHWLNKDMHESVKFIEQNIRIDDKPIQLYGYQKRYLEQISDQPFTVTAKFRQGGFTSMALWWSIWKCVNSEDYRILFTSGWRRMLDWVNADAQEVMAKMPKGSYPEITKFNLHYLEFANGSFINFASPSESRGTKYNALIMDEPAFAWRHDVSLLWRAVFPTLRKNYRIIVQSTPNGTKNWFYEIYMNSTERCHEVFHCSYREHPLYSQPDWQAKVRENLGEKGWLQEVEAQFL